MNGRFSTFFFNKFVFKLDNAPDTSAKQAVVLLRIFVRHYDVAQSEVRKFGMVAVITSIQRDRNLVDDGVGPFCTEKGKNFLRFVGTNKIIGEDFLDLLHALFNHRFVIGTAVLA